MLATMRRIVQEVSEAHDLAEAMQIVVRRVREAMETQACSVFLMNPKHSEYVLAATEGLSQKAIRKLRIGVGEGLVGFVGKREEPLNLEDAPSHPNFLHHPKAGEEQYKAFLGVPIIHQRHILGVLTVQEVEQRRFDEAEEAFLITMSAQLAGVIAHAEATGGIAELASERKKKDEVSLGGIPSVPGVGLGTAVVVYPPADLDAVPDREAEDIKFEIDAFNIALQAAREDIEVLSKRLSTSLPPAEHALFDVYLKILEGASLGKEVIAEIEKGQWAQAALRRVIKRHVRQFEAMEDEYLRERAVDFRDLGRRILAHLQATQIIITEYPDETILVGDEVTAAALAEVPEDKLAGLVSAKGSSSSHVAILARAMGIPTVMGAEGMQINQLEGKELIVDGYYGQVYVSPSRKLRKQFSKLAQEEKELDESLEVLRALPAETPDHHHIGLQVNIGLAMDAGLSLSVGAEGVGLYRTEVPFMTRDCFPTEEEQRVIYRQLLKAFVPRPVTMRPLDVGGDKVLPYFNVEEANPFLGWRGIRVTLDHPEVFLVQVRAMLKASAKVNNLRIMLPMITSVTEVDEALSLLKQAYNELIEEGEAIEMPSVGVMIEVPSAVYQAKEIAERVDFLSVGSNDLTQYILAVDRNNSRVAGLYDSLHPAMLRALMHAIKGGHAAGKPVSLCGEMASDPVSVLLLLAMGYNSLSMSATSLLRMKWVIRNFTKSRAEQLLQEALTMDHSAMIRFHLEQALIEAGLGGLIRAGKK